MQRGIFFTLMLFALPLAAASASTIKFQGTPGWNISSSRASISAYGVINNRPAGSISGTLRVVLWASANRYPAAGYRVAQRNMGQLRGGFRWGYFQTSPVAARLPNVSRPMHFTVVLEEYTGAGWRRVDFKPTGIKQIRNGKFVQAPAWKIPTTRRVSAPRRVLRVGDRLMLNLRAIQGRNLIPVGSVVRTTAVIRGQGQLTATSPAKTSPGIYSYRVAPGVFGGKRVQSGVLFIDWARAIGAAFRSSSTNRLFFHTPSTGTYNSLEVDPAGGGRTWGDFRFY